MEVCIILNISSYRDAVVFITGNSNGNTGFIFCYLKSVDKCNI
jgi:hypothetical protein